MKSTIPLFLAFLYLSTVVVAAQQQTSITTCGTSIRSPGRYELANDLLNCPGSGIQIQGVDGIVILNLNSHRITAAAGSTSTGIFVKLSSGQGNIAAIGGSGTISGFSTGLRTSGSGEVEVFGLTCTRNGIGFAIQNGAHADVARNTASENSHGFEINNSSSKFGSNTADHNLYEGFVINGQGNNFSENTAVSNGSYGISCTGSQNAITGNITRGNTTYDLFEANSGSGCVNQWTNNAFSSANKSCIH